MYRHDIWDFDGTLFDTYPSMTKAMQGALEMRGYSEPEDEIYSYLKVTTGHAKKIYKDKYGLGDDFDEDAVIADDDDDMDRFLSDDDYTEE